jgi:hypothetical protein
MLISVIIYTIRYKVKSLYFCLIPLPAFRARYSTKVKAEPKFNSKYYQSDTDNIDENSLKLSFIKNEAENEKYHQNTNINLYCYGTEYG